MSDPVLVDRIAIDVHTDGDTVTFSKPEREKKNHAYTVDPATGDITVDPSAVVFPLLVEFISTNLEYMFQGIGFEPALDPVETPEPQRYTSLGPCGGCFTLKTPALAASVQVEDDPGKNDKAVYFWKVWLENVLNGSGVTHDPRIYNHGKVDSPRAGRRGLWARFLAWLRRLFGGS